MNIRQPLAVSIVSLCAGLALAVPGLAEAKKTPVYKISLQGSQVSTWTQSHDPQYQCDATVRGNGSQSVTYKTFDPSRVTLHRPKGLQPYLASPSDEGAQYGAPLEMSGGAKVSREADLKIDAVNGPPCGGTGGGGAAPPPDCGERSGLLRFGLGYDVSWLAPEGGENVAGRLKLTGRYVEVDDAGLDVQPLDMSYENCPFWADSTTAAASSELMIASEKLPVRKLAGLKKGKSITVAGDAREQYADGDFAGDTLNAWTIRLKRVK